MIEDRLFSKEDMAMHEAETICQDESHQKNPLFAPFQRLFKQYKKTVRQLKTLTHMSDKQQGALTTANDKLTQITDALQYTNGELANVNIDLDKKIRKLLKPEPRQTLPIKQKVFSWLT